MKQLNMFELIKNKKGSYLAPFLFLYCFALIIKHTRLSNIYIGCSTCYKKYSHKYQSYNISKFIHFQIFLKNLIMWDLNFLLRFVLKHPYYLLGTPPSLSAHLSVKKE